MLFAATIPDPVAERAIVTAAQMAAIEGRLFAAGLPVAALMEKVAGKIATRIHRAYPRSRHPRVGVLAGPGHNGGDALVVARELHFWGYEVIICQPLAKLKELTAAHARYAASLGIPICTEIASLQGSELIIDGLFGFGLEREIAGDLAAAIAKLNTFALPTVSIDLPSGIHTDTGRAMGAAVRATHTLCLGLWKQAFARDCALEYLGKVERIAFDIPETDIREILEKHSPVRWILPQDARQQLPLRRSPVAHKYRQGHLLVVAGSARYAGSVVLTALGARATGAGMLTIAVPAHLKSLVVSQLPEAVTIACPETAAGAIRALPADFDFGRYDAMVGGPGLTLEPSEVVAALLAAAAPLVLDADALNLLAQGDVAAQLHSRAAPTVLTPHPGEFKRLFADCNLGDRLQAARQAARACGAIVLLKGARTIVAHPDEGALAVVPESTPALARGGSGDVLAGIVGGLAAQQAAAERDGFGRCDRSALAAVAATAAWWHARAGILAARARTVMGVDPVLLASYLGAVLSEVAGDAPGLGDN